MTDLFEFEEVDDARPIENSHLIKTRCRTCGATARAVPAHVRAAQCGACALEASGADGAVHGTPGPVVRYGTFALNPPEEVIAEFPKPTYIGRVGWSETLEEIQVPQPVLSLAEYARENSWEVRSQYTRGRFPHGKTGRPGAEQHVISLRFGGHPMTDRQAYAIYCSPVSKTAWTWGSIAIWGPDLPPYLGCGVTELRAYLSCEAGASFERGISDWIDDLKSISANGEALRKAREAKRREVRALHAAGESMARIVEHSGFTQEEIEKMVAKRSSGARKEAGG